MSRWAFSSDSLTTLLGNKSRPSEETLQPIEVQNSIHEGIPNSIKVHKIADRKNAIKKALRISSADDIVIIAGKGNEETIDYGYKTIEHNDIKYLKCLLHES